MKFQNPNLPTAAIFEQLNTQQKNAVNQTEGPVMVIAGPGTGKTQILSARIAKILLQTDCNPENILCLTFTEAGAVAMRKRLSSFIGPEAYKLNIHTFHSFCNSVIQLNKDIFGYLEWQPVSDIEKHEILRQIIDNLPANHPLKRPKGQVYYDVAPLLALFDLIKKESLTLDLITQKINATKLDALTNPEYRYKRKSGLNNAGDLKQKDIDALNHRLERLASAVALFDVFQNEMQIQERYDFNDMIIWVNHAFQNRPDLLSRYQEQFLYILVDEFQDTNTSQYQIVQQLSQFWEDNPNLFVVGDDDQAIYRFQGADISNINDFKFKYHKYLKTIVLEENYRSGQAILDVASTVIEVNTSRLKESKEKDEALKAANMQVALHANNPTVHITQNPYSESVHIASEIETLLKNGIIPSEIAIIYRKHKQVDQLIRYFKDKSIPFNLIKKENILQADIVNKFLEIIRFLAAELTSPFQGDTQLFKILHFPEFNLPVTSLAWLNRNASENKLSLRELMQTELPDLSLGKAECNKIRKTLLLIEEWIRELQFKTPVESIHHILVQGGFLQNILKNRGQTIDFEAIQTFFDFMKAEAERKKGLTLNEFLETIDLMTTYGLELSINHVFGNNQGINLMTAHGSKGLEFDHVYIIGCNESEWDSNNNKDTFSLKSIFPGLQDEHVVEDNRRLFYVAMTRARLNLNVSYYEKDVKGKEQSPSRYVIEMLQNSQTQTTTVQVADNDTLQFMLSYDPDANPVEITLLDKPYLQTLLQDYSLSVTHLNAYLKCPVSFYFNQILRVPAAKNSNMGFGSAVHGTLEKLFKNDISIGKMPDFSSIETTFEKQMFSQKASFTDKEYQRLIAYGKIFLPAYLNQRSAEWLGGQKFEFEKKIKTFLNDIPINGMLDRVSIFDRQVIVTDYKTGNSEYAKPKLKAPGEAAESNEFEFIHGGDYWRQIMFYKILIDCDSSLNWKMTAGEIDFVEPDTRNEFKKHLIQIDNESVEIVKGQIKNVYASIMNFEFDKGCGKEDCLWCNFARSYYQR